MSSPVVEPTARFARISRWQMSDALGNGVYNIITSVLSVAGRSALFILGPMFLDAAHFGVYAYYSWVSGVASQLGSGGAVQAAQHYTARYSRQGFQQSFQRYLFVVAVLLTIAAAGILLASPSAIPAPAALITLALVLAVATSVVAVEQALQQAKHDFLHPMLSEGGAQGARLVVLFAVQFASLISALALIVIDTCSMAVKTVLLLVMRQRFTMGATPQQPLGSAEKRAVGGYLASITGITLLNVLLWQRGEIFFLSMFATPAATAHFAAGSQLAQLLILAPTAALSSLLPKLSEKAGFHAERFHHVSNILLTASVMAALPLYCVTLAFAPVMLRIWKPEYTAIGFIFPQIMLGKLALVLSAPISLALYASGRQRTVLHVVALSAAIAVAVDYGLIRSYGVTGASWASAINQGFTSIATLVAGRKYLPLRLKLAPLTLSFCWIGLCIQVCASFSRFGMTSALCLLVLSAVIYARDSFITEALIPILKRR